MARFAVILFVVCHEAHEHRLDRGRVKLQNYTSNDEGYKCAHKARENRRSSPRYKCRVVGDNEEAEKRRETDNADLPEEEDHGCDAVRHANFLNIAEREIEHFLRGEAKVLSDDSHHEVRLPGNEFHAAFEAPQT